jgi:hypothetical protein
VDCPALVSPDRLRLVRHPVQPIEQIRQIDLQILGVNILGHVVDARGCVFPQPLKTSP